MIQALTAVRTQAVVCTQSSYRSCKVQEDMQHRHPAATRIQSFYRMHRAKLDYQAKKTAVAVIQNYFRSYIRVKVERENFLAVQKSVRIIQAAFRGMKVRERLKTLSEVNVVASAKQSAFCSCRTEAQCAAVHGSALRTQKWRGASLVTCSQEAEYPQREALVATQRAFCEMVTRKLETQKCAALRIQYFLPMAVWRRRFVQQKRAAVTLQQYFRTWQTRRQFLLYRKAAVVLQNHHRAFLSKAGGKEEAAGDAQAAVLIPATYRMHRTYVTFQTWKHASILIQQHYRTYRAAKLQREILFDRDLLL